MTTSRPFARPVLLAATLLTGLSACGRSPAPVATARRVGTEASQVAARDTLVDAVIEAAGTAGPILEATLSTRLMGTITEVPAREGDAVTQGTLLVRIDARDLDARAAQVAAQQDEAEAVRAEARLGAERLRRLHAESVATRAQLDAAETGLARAEAAVHLAQASAAELRVTAGYARVVAPFAGTVTRRFVDPGAFASPGAPLLTIEDGSRLRVAVSAGPDAVRHLRRGQRVEARIEDSTAVAIIEGVVPAPGGSTYTVNAIVENPGRRFLPHGAAVLLLPQGRATILVIPTAAVSRDGDLSGVRLMQDSGSQLRFVRLGRTVGTDVEVLSGLSAGDRVVMPRAGGVR